MWEINVCYLRCCILLQLPKLTKTVPHPKISPAPNSYLPKKSFRIIFFGARRLWIPSIQIPMYTCVYVYIRAHHAFSYCQPASYHLSWNEFLNQCLRDGIQMDSPSGARRGRSEGCARTRVKHALQEAPFSPINLPFDTDSWQLYSEPWQK